MIQNTVGSKSLYKLFISTIKYVPNILAFSKILGLILSYFGQTSFLLTCLGGTSITFLIMLYLISFIFRFCGLYRLSLNYISLITGLTIFDWYIGIPLSIEITYKLYTFISGVFVSMWIYVAYKNRNNPTIDYIKQLCDKYICK